MHHCLDEGSIVEIDLARHVDYIHLKPVNRAGALALSIGRIQHCMAPLSEEWQHRVGVGKWVIKQMVTESGEMLGYSLVITVQITTR